MRADAVSRPEHSAWLWKARLPGLLADFGYLCAISLGIVAQNSINAVFGEPFDQHNGALQIAMLSAVYVTVHIFPYLPVCAVAANLAPSSGFGRYVCFCAVAALALGWWRIADRLMGDPPTDFGLVDVLTWTLTIAACAYRSTARTSTSALMQRQIAEAALDAELKRARLQLLRAQIEPHFLFNTLATIRTLARVDRRSALEMIDSLARYLSEALPRLRLDEASIAEEFQLIEAYLRIHQIRMGTRLSYELSLPANLSSQRIPTMILLTLVENALKHGINPTMDGGSVRVSATRERSALLLEVADSGHGMSATEGHGMGLANVRRRLTMLYGDRAVLSLANAQSRGTVAIVSIPWEDPC
jgi:signal transduction histidine kinase